MKEIVLCKYEPSVWTLIPHLSPSCRAHWSRQANVRLAFIELQSFGWSAYRLGENNVKESLRFAVNNPLLLNLIYRPTTSPAAISLALAPSTTSIIALKRPSTSSIPPTTPIHSSLPNPLREHTRLIVTVFVNWFILASYSPPWIPWITFYELIHWKGIPRTQLEMDQWGCGLRSDRMFEPFSNGRGSIEIELSSCFRARLGRVLFMVLQRISETYHFPWRKLRSLTGRSCILGSFHWRIVGGARSAPCLHSF